jgi:serine/threonine protein phosphatase PrpC
MIRCPDCDQMSPDDARFCERCGRGLVEAPPPSIALPPLSLGKELQGRFKVVEIISQSSQENRYRAVALDNQAQRFMLRERIAPAPQTLQLQQETQATTVDEAQVDPISPTAKTRDLAPLASASKAASEAESNSPADAGAHAEPQAEADPGEPAAEVQSETASANSEDRHDADSSEQAAPGDGDAGAQPVVDAEPDTPHDGAERESAPPAPPRADLGEVFERVLAMSRTVSHPAYYRAQEGFAEDERVYLVYPDDRLRSFVRGQGSATMPENQALSVAIQICQAISYLHNRGMRVNDICPDSLAYGADGRVKLLNLDSISNDDELQSVPILNDGYTAPEIYRGKKVDKRADVFSTACVLYTCLTGERIECETWREEAGPIRFYPPHVISPDLEKVVRRALAFRPADRWPSANQFKDELLKLNSGLQIRSGCLTHVGMVRELNEDSVMALEYVQDSQVAPARHYLYVVSDGMGGAAAGETASAIAVQTIQDYVEKRVLARSADGPEMESEGDSSNTGPSRGKDRAGEPPGPLEGLVQGALEEANRQIVGYQTAHPDARGMGATAVSALVNPPDAAVAWVGDSRAYLWENGRLRQLTKDHSLVQRLVEIGQITAEEARHHEHKNVITRSLGARASGPAGAEALKIKLKRGDRLMLCSDGLMAHVEDSAIAEILGRRGDPVEASRELVVAANAGGGTDNISVIVIAAE